LILIYKSELNSWLYILITRLMLKIGSDTLGSIQSRILKTFELIRESFSPEDQFVVIIRFLSDQTQTPNVRVKTSILQYLIHLIPLMDSNDINFNSRNNHEIQLSLMKIISWTADPKSSDLRRISQDVIVDLYNLNAADMSLIINALPKTYEDAALQIIYHKRRGRSQSPAFSPLTPVSLRTPSVIKTSEAFNKLSLYDETENLNPDDIYNSLRKTTDEIQKYSFHVDSDSITTITNSSTNNHNSSDDKQTLSPTISPKKTVLGRNMKDLSSASQDSGISQLDGTSIGHNNRQTPVTSPSKANTNETIIPIVFSQNGNHSYVECENGAYFNTVLIGLRSHTKDTESQKESLNDLIELIREGSNEEWAQRFKDVYRILLDKMTEQSNSAVRAMSLRVMCELLMKRTKYFPEFIELTILRILESSKDPEKEVVRAAEGAAGTASAVLPPDQCLQILKSVIKTGENPVNIAAIKMLTKVTKYSISMLYISNSNDLITFL
jgi:CLIP-associating protein 1/2